MNTAFDIRDALGNLRRYILVRYPKSFSIWDRHLKCRVGGFYRDFEYAEFRMRVLNKEIRV
jgi:hypothetical protein